MKNRRYDMFRNSPTPRRTRFTPALLKRGRFTLIELLVAITVIAILAALLLPMLSRAKYQARLVLCMNNLKQAAYAATIYADDYDERYPHRKAIYDGGWGGPENVKARHMDDRPLWPVIGLDEIWCPFNEKMDTQQDAPYVFDSYAYYFGFGFGGNPIMRRLGETFKYGSNDFDLLASDLNVYDNTRLYRSSHPDRFGALYVWSKSIPLWFLTVKDTSTVTGPVDLNFARTDGSVFTERKVTQFTADMASRLSRVPRKRSIGVNSSEWRYVPQPE